MDAYICNMNWKKFKPSVRKEVLLFIAGLLWIMVGLLLLRYAAGWLAEPEGRFRWILVAAGTGAALIIHHFGFLRVVDKNLGRILPMEGGRCVFSFMSWKSYLLVAVMMGMGILLRFSPLPETWLSMLYLAIGLALILSSIRYFRVLVGQWKQM